MTEPRLMAFETGKPFYDMVAVFLVGLSPARRSSTKITRWA